MSRLLQNQQVCFIGAGSIAESMLRGILEQGIAAPEQVSVLNRSNRQRLLELNQNYGVQTAGTEADKQAFIRKAEILVAAMKPKDAPNALRALRHEVRPGQLLISVIAGLSIQTIEQYLGCQPPIVRAMPNTSSLIGLGATGLCFSKNVSPNQEQLALKIFQAIGVACTVTEPQLDIVTGVSGSGPAYVYYFMEAVIKAGIQGGLSPEIARELTVQTVLGAAQMVKQTSQSPEQLRLKVTSPNGTTAAAIQLLNGHEVSQKLIDAVLRAAERSRELGAILQEEKDE